MRGFLAFTLGTALVYALALIASHDPNLARWIGLGLLGLVFVVSAVGATGGTRRDTRHDDELRRSTRKEIV